MHSQLDNKTTMNSNNIASVNRNWFHSIETYLELRLGFILLSVITPRSLPMRLPEYV